MSNAKLKIAATNEIKIEKGIPVKSSGSGRIAKYPFRKMEVGDSFLFPEGYKQSHYYGMAREFTVQCRAIGQNWKFVARKTDAGYRCWRVE